MNLTQLLYLHSIITLSAGVLLLLVPDAIPNSVGLAIEKPQYLICYFLGCAEIAIAFLSFRAALIKDKIALKIIVQTIIVFHLLTAFAEGITLFKGLSIIIAINIFFRIIVVIIFFRYGFNKKS